MTDPVRLSRSPDHSLAALLLRAGAQERPSAVVRSRTAAAITLALAGSSAKVASAAAAGAKPAASVATAGSSALSTATAGVGAVAKWIAIGALGGAVTLSSVQALIAEHQSKPAAVQAAAPGNALAASARQRPGPGWGARAPAASVTPEDRNEAVPPSSVEVRRAPVREGATSDLAKPEASGRAESGLLAAEVRFVDQGRAALQRAAFTEALERLAPYEGLFPRQQLLTEVLFLRMEASRRLGDGARARALAARLLELGVAGRQAAQAREVLAH